MHRSLNIALLNSASNYKFDIFYELLIKQKILFTIHLTNILNSLSMKNINIITN